MPESKRKKVPKFVIARNEAAAPGTTFIVHTQEPSFIGEFKKFKFGAERDEYFEANRDKEFLEVSPLQFVEIKKYLTSDNMDNRRDFLQKAIKHWIISHNINSEQLQESLRSPKK